MNSMPTNEAEWRQHPAQMFARDETAAGFLAAYRNWIAVGRPASWEDYQAQLEQASARLMAAEGRGVASMPDENEMHARQEQGRALYYKQFPTRDGDDVEFTAEQKRDLRAAGISEAKMRASMSEKVRDCDMTTADFVKAIGRGFTPAVETAIVETLVAILRPLKQEIAALRAQVAELEARPALKYLGVFRDDGRKYSEGSAVTHDGSLWIALKATTERPNGSADWQLAVKSGQSTSHPRENGHDANPRSR
jgi:hypothetical protein